MVDGNLSTSVEILNPARLPPMSQEPIYLSEKQV